MADVLNRDHLYLEKTRLLSWSWDSDDPNTWEPGDAWPILSEDTGRATLVGLAMVCPYELAPHRHFWRFSGNVRWSRDRPDADPQPFVVDWSLGDDDSAIWETPTLSGEADGCPFVGHVTDGFWVIGPAPFRRPVERVQ